ncbi:MAG: C10 family peptidase [bacterium]
MQKNKFQSLFLTTLFLFLISFFSNPLVLKAQTEYGIIAQNLLNFLHSDKEIISSRLIESDEINGSLTKTPIAYLAKLEWGGFILISVSRDLTPIKAYSLFNDFETLPKGYTDFLLQEMEYNTRALEEAIRALKKPNINAENQQRWDFLLNYTRDKVLYKYTPDTFLLKTRWNQKHPFNKFLPEIGEKHVLAGCVSIALAQIMKYHRYPSSGNGVVSYNWNGQYLKAILYKDYHWGNMPDITDMLTPQYKEDEVARLISDLGIANETDFGVDSSPTIVNMNALIKNFGYSSSIDIMDKTDEDLFFKTIRNEIDASRPVLVRFPDHMGVADGYASDGAGKKIHLNFGWKGKDDGYYFLDQNIVVTNHVYPPDDLKIYYNIKPCSGADCYVNLEAGDTYLHPYIYGTFNSENDTDEYEVYLKGPTNISGTRYHFSTQAFYITIYNSKNNLVASDENAISAVFPVDKYRIKTSLCSNRLCYKYDDGYLNYAVYITTSALTYQEKIYIENNSDIAPKINNSFKNIIINRENGPYRILIDAVDENGDDINLTAFSSNNNINAAIDLNNVLTITPAYGVSKIAGKIRVMASANNKSVEKSFIVLVTDEDISFGKEFVIADKFLNQYTFHKHKVILDGVCTITGDSGSSDQDFFTSVMDSDENYIADPNDFPIIYTFLKGFYLAGASLCPDPNSPEALCYSYQEGDGDIYEINFSCPDADEDISPIAKMLGIDISEIIPEGVGEDHQYSSIQKAIDNAVKGDTIIVHDGTYFENINFKGKAITVCSKNGPSATFIDGNSTGSVVGFDHNEDANSVLKGFTIRNGYAEKGGGIFCQDSFPEIIDCFIEDNMANSNGGGIYSNNGAPKTVNCLLRNNKSKGLPDQISIETDSGIFQDIRILNFLHDSSSHMQVYNNEKGSWTPGYLFFKRPCGESIHLNESNPLFISQLP